MPLFVAHFRRLRFYLSPPTRQAISYVNAEFDQYFVLNAKVSGGREEGGEDGEGVGAFPYLSSSSSATLLSGATSVEKQPMWLVPTFSSRRFSSRLVTDPFSLHRSLATPTRSSPSKTPPRLEELLAVLAELVQWRRSTALAERFVSSGDSRSSPFRRQPTSPSLDLVTVLTRRGGRTEEVGRWAAREGETEV